MVLQEGADHHERARHEGLGGHREGLWNQRLATGETRLTAAHAAAARPPVEARVTEYCQRRHRELEAGGLLPAALAVAPLFQAGPDATATDRDVDAALAAAAGLSASGRLAARDALDRLGYVWRPPGHGDDGARVGSGARRAPPPALSPGRCPRG